MESKLAAKGVFLRNNHSNSFHIKIPSHNASRKLVENMWHAYILNKLALIPFHEDQKTTQLYKNSLENLIELPGQCFKDEEFVDNLTDHLTNWDIHMRQFGSWLFTRTAFFSIQQKVKKNRSLWKKVVLKRALLEPNKHQFLNKSLTETFQNKQLLELIDRYRGVNKEKIAEEQIYRLPRDILFEDDDACWRQLQQQYQTLDREDVEDYIEQYMRVGIAKYVHRTMKQKSKDETIKGLLLRKQVLVSIKNDKVEELSRALEQLQIDC